MCRYFPSFYCCQAFLQGEKISTGLSRYHSNIREDLPAIWSVWVPAQLFNFAFSPLWLRVPFTTCVSMGWTGYVSFSRGAKES